MSIYTTVNKILFTVPSVNSISNITSEAIIHYINRAEALVNAKISNIYTVPLSNNIPILELIATDLAIYEIIGKRQLTSNSKDKNDWPSRFKEASELLTNISNGKMPLYTNSGNVIAKSTANVPWSNTADYTPTFQEDNSVLSEIDSDKLDDIDASRL